MSSIENVLARITTLDDDFAVIWGRRSPPDEDALLAFEAALGIPLRDDHRALIARIGYLALFAKEEAWPRPAPFETRPRWQMVHGLEVFGLCEASARLDVRAVREERAPSGSDLVPALGALGDDEVIGYGRDGVLVSWSAGGAPEAIEAESLFSVLDARIATLSADKERVKVAPAAGGEAAGPTEEDPLLARLCSSAKLMDWFAACKTLEATTGPRRERLADGLLAAVMGEAPNKAAIGALGRLGDLPRVASVLAALAVHPSEEARGAALRALRRAGLPEATEIAVAALDDAHPDVREAAVEGLTEAPVARAIDPLLEALARAKQNERWSFGVEVGKLLVALALCGGGESRSLDAVVAHLEVKHNPARSAFEGLTRLGPLAEGARPTLERLAGAGDPWLGVHARGVLVAMGDDPALHLPAVVEALGSPEQDGAVSASATSVLRDIGEVAIPFLERAAAEGDAAVRKPASRTLAMMTRRRRR